MSRSFAIEHASRGNKKFKIEGGRYISDTPAQAVKKAFSQIYRQFCKCGGKMVMIIHIKETTKDSNKKTYKYKVSKIAEHKTVERDGKTITFKYRTKVEAI
jgi:hypothetical protein